LTIAFRFAIRRTPSASVTVVTIGKPSGIAATARDTVYDISDSRGHPAQLQLTSDSKHIKPGAMLQHPDEANDTNNAKRDHRELFREFVHAQLQRRPLLLDLPIQ
jgi:hypothetical protein